MGGDFLFFQIVNWNLLEKLEREINQTESCPLTGLVFQQADTWVVAVRSLF